MPETRPRWWSRPAVAAFVASAPVQAVVIGVILLNAIILGLQTDASVVTATGSVLEIIDRICLGIFVVELLLKLYGLGLGFFRSGWNVFDLAIVAVALIPATGSLSVLRTLRVLRVLRLISIVPSIRRVVDALVGALPGIGAAAALLAIIYYVAAVMATGMFAASAPEEFGSLGASAFTLFQLMTFDDWAALSRQLAPEHPYAPAFFIVFIIVTAMLVLNLFIAVVVDAMQSVREQESKDSAA